MGMLRQVMHRSGAHTEAFMQAYADRQRGLAAEIAAVAPCRAELARRLPAAEKQAAALPARSSRSATVRTGSAQRRGARAEKRERGLGL